MPDSVADAGMETARAAIARHDWQAAHDAATRFTMTDAAGEAERLDLVADACWWLGRLEECIRAREQAHGLFEDLGHTRRSGNCAVWLYEHHAFAGRRAIAGAWLSRARRHLERDPECVPAGALLLREAECAHGQGDLDVALANAQEAIGLARRLHSFDLEAEALQTAGRVRIDQGDVPGGMSLLDEAMLLAIGGRLRPYSTGKVYCSLISACEDVGDLDRADEWTEATDRWARDHPLSIFPGICRMHRAVVLKRRGALDQAEREAVRACGELEASRPTASAAAWIEVGDIRRRLGDLARAEEALERACGTTGSTCAALALLRLAQGQVATAHTIIRGCLDGTTPSGRVKLLADYVQIAVAAGDLHAAAAAVEELRGSDETERSRDGQARALVADGRVRLARGEAQAARAVLQEALTRWRALDVPYEAATTETLLGQALRECGEHDAAHAAFVSAAATFDRMGAVLDARHAAGDAPPRRALPAGLTEREAEVLRLVAAGLANSDIAATLCISAKTVSRHLSNIFTKIGVSSRAAATAFAFEHDVVRSRRDEGAGMAPTRSS